MYKIYIQDNCPKCHELIEKIKETQFEDRIEIINVSSNFSGRAYLVANDIDETPAIYDEKNCKFITEDEELFKYFLGIKKND